MIYNLDAQNQIRIPETNAAFSDRPMGTRDPMDPVKKLTLIRRLRLMSVLAVPMFIYTALVRVIDKGLPFTPGFEIGYLDPLTRFYVALWCIGFAIVSLILAIVLTIMAHRQKYHAAGMNPPPINWAAIFIGLFLATRAIGNDK